MDMLAELVVLRNRRESHLTEFNQLNDELSRCALRLKYAEEQQYYEIDNVVDSHKILAELRNGSSTLSEIGKDISTVSLGLRELQKPVSHDNSSISRFIRDFRQELMQLRRVPVSGLFQRLQRACAMRRSPKTSRFSLKLSVNKPGWSKKYKNDCTIRCCMWCEFCEPRNRNPGTANSIWQKPGRRGDAAGLLKGAAISD